MQDLVPHLGITIGAVSQHLKVLLNAGLVVRRKQGRHRFYRAQPHALKEVYDWTAQYETLWQSSLKRLGTYLDEK